MVGGGGGDLGGVDPSGPQPIVLINYTIWK
jgi:hypothetical protein